jgi:transketolase
MTNQKTSPTPLTADMPLRDAFGQALVSLGRRNPHVVVLTADLGESTRAHLFAKEFPTRFFQVGVAEQNMMGVATGLALSGKIPFVCSFAVFNPGRNWDQLRVGVCYSKANVKVIGGHAGFSNGGDGGTHQALEDIAITRCLPNLTVVSPADSFQTYKAVFALAEHDGPSYLRVSRSGPYSKSDWEGTTRHGFDIGKAQVLRHGQHVTIVATGLMVNEAMSGAQILAKKGIDAEVMNVHTIKPIDGAALVKSAWKTGAVVTIEEHQKFGGLGSAVLEALAGNVMVPVKVLGVDDQFGESGPPAELAAKHGLTAKHLVAEVEHLLKH